MASEVPRRGRAMALADVCMGEEARPGQLTVFVDARPAAETKGETGVVLEAGPRIGRGVLEGILCDANVEVIARAEMVNISTMGATIGPRLLFESVPCWTGGRVGVPPTAATADTALEAHHLTAWSQGGETSLDGLVLLC